MTLKDQILLDLSTIKNPYLLNQIFDFIQLQKKMYATAQESNKNDVLQFAGVIDDKEAENLSNIIDEEFNQIEGGW